MKLLLRLVLILAATALLASACGGEDGSIVVEDARYRIATSDLGAGYLTITNSTGESVTLQSATAPGVGRIELHESLMADDGTMAMESRPNGFTIESGETISLEPGGKHLMLFDPEGTEDLNIDLNFGDEIVTVLASYDAEASASIDDMDDMEHGDDHDMEDMDEMEDMDSSDS